MRSKLFVGRLPVLAVALATAAACSQTPQSPLSPSGTLGAALGDTASGATLKVTPPLPVSPIGGETIEGRKPAFVFQNSAGLFVEPGAGTYRLELYEEGTLIAEIGVGANASGGTSYEFPNDLEWETTHTWRVRLELEGAQGPWSEMATFVTPEATKLGFEVPGSCAPIANPMSNRLACVHDISVLSDYWTLCTGRGDKVACHRFVRQVAAALAVGDPRWGLISKNPGDFQCTWDRCWNGDGAGYGEDVVAYHYGPGPSNWEGFDTIVGAGAPGSSMGWTRLDSKRPGNNWASVPPFP